MLSDVLKSNGGVHFGIVLTPKQPKSQMCNNKIITISYKIKIKRINLPKRVFRYLSIESR